MLTVLPLSRRRAMSEAPVILEIKNSVAHLTLNNPPKNEMDSFFFRELTRLRRETFPALQVKGMIIYGRKRHFSSGANINELKTLYQSTNQKPPTEFLNDNQKTFLAIESLPFPVVAVINGCCLGAGLELALSCHYRIASPHAVFSLPEITFGLMPGCGGTIRLPKVVGKSKAMEMILTGDIISAEEACDIGLIEKVVEKREIMNRAHAIINPIRTANNCTNG